LLARWNLIRAIDRRLRPGESQRAGGLIWIKERPAVGFYRSLFDAGLARLADSMSSNTRPMPRPKHCPICGLAMLGSRIAPTSTDVDRFECLGCDLVINYSGSKKARPAARDE
jgi:hypothetical protein